MDYFDLKGIVDEMMDALHISNFVIEPDEHSSFQKGAAALLSIDKSPVGNFGIINSQISTELGLNDHSTLAADFNLSLLINSMPDLYTIKPVSKFPPIIEDIALIIDENINSDEVTRTIIDTGGATLIKTQLFDVFRGEQIGANKKSLAYRLTYQSAIKTLSDKDAAHLRNKIVNKVTKSFNAQLRDK